MLTSFLQTVLPGIRDVRTPFVSGLLWLLLCWPLMSSMIPDPALSTGFLQQAFGVAEYVGSTAVVSAATVVAYVVGLLGVAVGDMARDLAIQAGRPFAWVNWKRRQQLAIRRHRRTVRASLQAAPEDGREGPNKVLQVIEDQQRLFGLWIAYTEVIRKMVGVRLEKPTGREDSEDQIGDSIRDAYLKALDAELRARKISIAADRHSQSARVGALTDTVMEQVFDRDPLDFLRAVDDNLYQAFDRERSEREFRIAVMPPAVGLGICLAVWATPWAWFAVVFAAMTFLQSAAVQSQERRRVLDHVVLRGLPKTILEAAEVDGRLDAGRLEAEREKQAAKETRAATEQALKL